jgi:hypothetical protein
MKTQHANLQLILFNLVIRWKSSKLCSQLNTLVNIFRGNKIHRNLNARLQTKMVSTFSINKFITTIRKQRIKLKLHYQTGYVLSDLQIPDLVRTSCRNEHRFTKLLLKRPGFNTFNQECNQLEI